MTNVPTIQLIDIIRFIELARQLLRTSQQRTTVVGDTRLMQNPGYIALSRQIALTRQMDVTANNIANLGTTGFKRQNSVFAEHLSKMENGESASYVLDTGTMRDMRQGPLSQTGGSLDLAIEGNGYFSVETPLGARYGRDGSFTRSADGQLVTRNGYPVLDENDAPITLPAGAKNFTVGKQGEVFADDQQVARIQLVDFNNPQALIHTAGGLYKADGAPKPAEGGTIRQGMLENSNVNPVIELVNLLGIQRDYQATHRLMKSEHDRLNRAIKELGRVEQG